MLNRLKGIFSGGEGKEAPPVELPEASPFENMDTETAPPPAHRPDHVKSDIGHSGHMSIVARSEEEAAGVGAEALRLTRVKKSVMYGDDVVSAYISDFPYLKFLTITKNGNTLCTFPFFNIGKPVDARITGVTECENGCEGQLEIFGKGSTLTFFDALYFKNKNRYFPGKDAKVLLSGVAYVLTKARSAGDTAAGAQKADQPGTDLAFRYENGDVDDYIFRGRAKEVREFVVLGKRAQAIRVPLRVGTADSALDIYVCATENATGEKIHKGDYVSGIMWLQGFIL